MKNINITQGIHLQERAQLNKQIQGKAYVAETLPDKYPVLKALQVHENIEKRENIEAQLKKKNQRLLSQSRPKT